MTKPLVIYHDNCADGFGAAFAAWLALGDSAEYLPLMYGKVGHANDLPCVKGRDVYILDFSLDRGIMETLMILTNVIWLDHHKTAFEIWCGGVPEGGVCIEQLGTEGKRVGEACSLAVLNNNKSGAMLAWEYFHPGTEVPMLIRHIDDYDRWQFQIDGTKEFNKALWSYAPWSFEQWRGKFLAASAPDTLYRDDLFGQGAAILRAHDQNVQSVVKGAARECAIEMVRIKGRMPTKEVWAKYFGLAANCPPHLTSDVGHELAVQSGTFGLCWTLNQTKPVANCSLRSNGDYDVSAIAKAFGGGGHKNAAGFQMPIGWEGDPA